MAATNSICVNFIGVCFVFSYLIKLEIKGFLLLGFGEGGGNDNC